MQTRYTTFMIQILLLAAGAGALMAQYPEPGGSGGGGGGGGGASSISGLTDLQLTRGSGTVLNIAAGTARIGNKPVTFSAATATLSGATATSTAYVYVSSSGALTVGHNGAATITCSGCTVATGITDYPADSLSIGKWTYTASAWDVSGGTSARTLVGGNILAAGTGISVSTDAAGVNTISTTGSGSTIGKGLFSARPSCSSTTQLYLSTDSPGLSSICVSSAWTDYFADAPITRVANAAALTAVNSPTLADSGAFVTLTKSTSGLSLALLALPDTGASWDIRMTFSPYGMWQGSATSLHECGLYITNGTTAGTNNAHGLVIGTGSDSAAPFLMRRSYTPIDGSIVDEALTARIHQRQTVNLRLTRSAGNVTAYIGDGVDWVAVQTDAPGWTATHYGIGCDPRGSSTVAVKLLSLTVQ